MKLKVPILHHIRGTKKIYLILQDEPTEQFIPLHKSHIPWWKKNCGVKMEWVKYWVV